MRSIAVTAAFCLSAAVALGGMSGTYAIRPDGGGDFFNLYTAGEALMDSGMSGNCVFELYGDTLSGFFGVSDVAGSDSWSTTFRYGPSARPLITGEQFMATRYHNVRLEGLRVSYVPISLAGCVGWRVTGCRFETHDWGLELEDCAFDTIDGNTFMVDTLSGGHASVIMLSTGSDNVVCNNFVNSETYGVEEALVQLDETRNARLVFNTIRHTPCGAAYGNCIWVLGENPCDLRNNLFVLAPPAEEMNACVLLTASQMDSLELDYNCYYVESLGWVGMRDSVPPVRYDWNQWRGFGLEANGINADPMLVSAYDLHLRPGSPCNQRATPIAGISFDIDGDPRDPTHPDMGADEIAGSAVEQPLDAEVRTANLGPTILSGASAVKRLASCVAFDAMGRRVLSPKSGIYFLREAPGGQPSAVTKVVVAR